MKLRNTLILLVAGGALAAYVFFVENKRPTTREASEAAGRVAQVDRDKVNSISIKNPEGKIELTKGANNEWSLTEPVKDRADSMAISQLFTSLETLKHDSRIEAEKKDQLKEFGVDDSSTKIRLNTEGGKATELIVGKDTAVEGKVYVRIDGSDTVYVVSNDLKNQLNKKAADFRDRKLADITAQQVNRLVVKSKDGEIVLEKKNSHWSITKPLQARADDSKVNDLVANATAARIDQFISDSSNLANYGLTEPKGTIEFYTEESAEKPLTLQIGGNGKEEADKEKTFVKLSTRDSVVLVPKEIENILSNKPNDLRDRNLVRVDSDIVDRISVEVPNKPAIVMARKGESWVRKDGDKEVEINDAIPTRLLADIQNTQVTNFVADTATELPKYGLDQPAIKVTLSSYASENTPETTAGDKPIVSVLIGKVEGDSGYAKLDDEPFIVAAPKTLLDQIPTDPIQLQPVAIYNYQPDQITHLEVGRMGQPSVTLEKQSDGQWKLAKGDGKVNQEGVKSVVKALSKLSAVRWLGPTTEDHALANPVVSATFTATDGDKTVNGKLKIGPFNHESASYAAADGLTGTFLISKPDRDAFDATLLEQPEAAPAPAAPAMTSTQPEPAPEAAPSPSSPVEAVTPAVQAPPAPAAPEKPVSAEAAPAAEQPAAPEQPAGAPAQEKPATAEEKSAATAEEKPVAESGAEAKPSAEPAEPTKS